MTREKGDWLSTLDLENDENLKMLQWVWLGTGSLAKEVQEALVEFAIANPDKAEQVFGPGWKVSHNDDLGGEDIVISIQANHYFIGLFYNDRSGIRQGKLSKNPFVEVGSHVTEEFEHTVIRARIILSAWARALENEA